MTLPTPDALIKGHRAFTSTEPTDLQRQLYEAFPAHRGPVASTFDTTLFEATLIMGLVQTVGCDTKVYFFVPATMEAKALTALQEFATRVFADIKARKAVNQAKALGKAFNNLLLGNKVMQMQGAPERWVAFGFDRKDPIPEWLDKSLLSVQDCTNE